MLLNGVALNGAPLDGAQVILTQGSANFNAGSAGFVATATYVWEAYATVDPTAAISATATRIQLPTATLDQGQAAFAPTATLNNALKATIDPTAAFVAFVLRMVEAQATVNPTCVFNAVADGFFGQVDFNSGSCGFTATAERGQACAATFTLGSAAFTATGLAIRKPTATFNGTSSFYAEWALSSGGHLTQYVWVTINPTGDFSIDDHGIVIKQGGIFCQPTCGFIANAHQRNKAQATFTPTCGLLATGTTKLLPVTVINPTATVMGTAVRNCMGSGLFSSGAVDFTGSMRQTHAATATIDPSASAAFSGEVQVPARVVVAATGNFVVSAVVEATGVANMGGTVDWVIEAVLNGEALDPPERTMYRAFVDREMHRQFVDREMLREAA